MVVLATIQYKQDFLSIPFNKDEEGIHWIMYRLLTLLIAFWLFAPTSQQPIHAQKALKPLKTSLKNKDYKGAKTQADKLKQDSTLQNVPELTLYEIEALKGLNDAENTKLYLKQKYDTTQFFSTTRLLVEASIHLDSLVSNSETQTKKYKRLHEEALSTLRSYYPNLSAAARFFYAKGKYGEAMPYLRLALDIPQTEIGKKAGITNNVQPEMRRRNAALYLTAAFNAQQYNEVWRYDSLALKDEKIKPVIYECLVLSAEKQKDSVAYKKFLETGWEEYPRRTFFFSKLADFYARQRDFNKVYEIAQKQLGIDTTSTDAMLAQCLALQKMERYNEAITVGNKLIETDEKNSLGYFYIGISYMAKAYSIDIPDKVNSKSYKIAIKRQQELLRQACPYLEKYKDLEPNEKDRWAPLLYKIYFTLNDSKKFEEMDKLIN